MGAALSIPMDAYPRAIVFGIAGAVVLVVLHVILGRFSPPGPERRPWRRVAVLAYLLLILSSGTLAATALWATLTGEPFRGGPLFVHALASGPFVGALCLLAIVWVRAAAPGVDDRFSPSARFAWWVTLLLGSATALSMLVPMLPRFSTAEMERLLDAHRWCGLGTVICLLAHARLATAGRRTIA